MTNNISQLKQLFNSVDFSLEAKSKIDEIFTRADQQGNLSDEDLDRLNAITRADMALDLIELKAHEGNLKKLDSVFDALLQEAK